MRLLIALTAIIAISVVMAACGGDDDSTDSASASSGARAVTIKMSEFAFTPNDATAPAGKVTIEAPNTGKQTHELVLLKTDENPAKLPKKGNKVDESTSVGEISDVEPGATKKHTFDLQPGKYAMVCALPGHYESGMYGSLTVR
jgi:uncharacterized cupredoxin-like copper-binding protein